MCLSLALPFFGWRTTAEVLVIDFGSNSLSNQQHPLIFGHRGAKSVSFENSLSGLKKALDKIKILSSKQDKQSSNELPANISALFTMVSDCIQYGTTQFSILARHTHYNIIMF